MQEWKKSSRVTGKTIHTPVNDSEGPKPLGSRNGSMEQTLARIRKSFKSTATWLLDFLVCCMTSFSIHAGTGMTLTL